MLDHKRQSSLLLKIGVSLSTTITEYLIENIKVFQTIQFHPLQIIRRFQRKENKDR